MTARRRSSDPAAEVAALRAEVVAHPDDASVRMVYADYLAERGGVFADVVAHPADDTARLACAAVLEAEGDPLGELIRVEVALAREDAVALADRARYELWSRRRALRTKCEERLAAFARGTAAHEIRRGLVDQIAIAPADLKRSGKRLFAASPIQRVTLLVRATATLDELAPIAAHLPASVTHVTIAGRLEDKPGRRHLIRVDLGGAPAAMPLLANRTLGFASIDAADDAAWHAPFALAAAARVRGLVFETGPLPPIAVVRPMFASIETLETNHGAWPLLASALAADGAPHLRRLETAIEDTDLLDLLAVAPTKLPALRELELWYLGNSLDVRGLARLATLLVASPVRRLVMSHTDFRLADALAGTPIELVRRARGERAELGSFLEPYDTGPR